MVLTGLYRTLALIGAMLAGVLVPQAHVAAPLIRWLVIGMLFIVFLQVKLSRSALHRSHGWLLTANVAMAFVGWAIGAAVGGPEVALAGFFTGLAPTAIAAPVIISFLRGRVEYVVASFVLGNLAIAALSPVILPPVLGRISPADFGSVLGTVCIIVFAPMGAALLLRRVHPPAAGWPARLRTLSFSMWVVTLFLVSANASHFIRLQSVPPTLLLLIAATSLAVCILNFALGHRIGGPHFAREASQSLGQKNTTFTIYLALLYATPVVALGPTCYVVWHNLWNSWQLHRAGRQARS